MAEFDEMDMDHKKDPQDDYDDLKQDKIKSDYVKDEPNLIELKDSLPTKQIA